jgi:hypothetical protein
MIISKNIFKYLLVTFLFFVSFVASASYTDGVVDPISSNALLCTNDLCTTSTRINFKTTLGLPVHITDTSLTGNIWSETFGWVNLNPNYGGVTNTSSGVLGGYAWGDGAGWINFKPTKGGVTINTSGKFGGYAWSENYGWIKFDCAVTNACVSTDWRPLSVRENNGNTGGGSTGGSSVGSDIGQVNIIKDICPNISGVQTLIPSGLIISLAGNCISSPPIKPTEPPVVPVVTPVNPVNPNNPNINNPDVTTNPTVPDVPTISSTEPVVPSSPDEASNNNELNKNTNIYNNITNKIINFFASILGTFTNVSNFAITQNSFSGLKENINIVTYFLGVVSENAINKTSEFIKDPVGKAVTRIVTTGGAISGMYFGIINVAFSSPLSFAEIFLTPMRLWTLLLIALGVKRRNVPWGTVYDSVTKQPLDPVYVVLQNLKGEEIATSITDLDGRYGFLVPPGQYRLLANKNNYIYPSKKLNGRDRDELYQELYFGDIIEIQEGGVITKNIPMDSIKFDWNEFTKKDKNLMKFFSRRELVVSRIVDILFAFGFIFTVISVLISPVVYNIIIFILYVLMIVMQKTILKPRAFGHIKERETKNPLSFAIVRVFYDGTDNEIIHKVADQTGKYYCLVPNGIYYTKIESKNDDESYSLAHTSEQIEVKNGYINKVFEI